MKCHLGTIQKGHRVQWLDINSNKIYYGRVVDFSWVKNIPYAIVDRLPYRSCPHRTIVKLTELVRS